MQEERLFMEKQMTKKMLSPVEIRLLIAQLDQKELRGIDDDDLYIRNSKQWATTMTPEMFLQQVKHALEEQLDTVPLSSASSAARWYLTLLDHLEGERYTVWLADHFLYGPAVRSAAEQIYASTGTYAIAALVEDWETIVKTTMPKEHVQQIIQQERHGRYGDPVRVLSGYFASWEVLETVDVAVPPGYALLWGGTNERFYPVEKRRDGWGGPLFSALWRGNTSSDPVSFVGTSQGKRRALGFLHNLAKEAFAHSPVLTERELTIIRLRQRTDKGNA
jgi:hypothetical protein